MPGSKFILSGLRCEQRARFDRVQTTCFEILSYKTHSTFKASYVFPFSPPVFSLPLGGSCLPRSTNSGASTDPGFGARQCRVLEGSCSKCQSCSLLPAGLGVEEWAQRPQEDFWGRGCVITASRIGLQMVLLEEEALQTGEGTSTGSCRAQLSMGHCTCPSPAPAPRGKAQNLGTCQCHEVVPS